MTLTNILLGIAFTAMSTNFHRTETAPMMCAYCTNAHHWRLVDVHRVTKETRVHVMLDGQPVERVIESVPWSAIMVTNYVADFLAAQRRGRAMPMPLVPVPVQHQVNTNLAELNVTLPSVTLPLVFP